MGDWVTVKGEADTLCRVWSSIAGSAFIVPLKRPCWGRMVRRSFGFDGSECFKKLWCAAMELEIPAR